MVEVVIAKINIIFTDMLIGPGILLTRNRKIYDTMNFQVAGGLMPSNPR